MSDPLKGPIAVGTKTTEMTQLECPTRKEPQLFCAVKSPLMAIVMLVSEASPVLVSRTCCGVLFVPTVWGREKFRLLPESTAVAAAWPLPESCAVCVPSSSVMENTPARPPAAVGLKVMETVQPKFGASDVPQVFALI